MKLGILVSGNGSNLQSIMDYQYNGSLEIAIVISNNDKAFALERAKKYNIPTAVISNKKYKERKIFEDLLIDKLREYEVELVALAGFMRVLTSHFLQHFNNRVINIHPSLLPSFPGVDAQKQALEYGVKFSGCTIHFVDEGMDTGAIISQAVVPVLENDTVESLKLRILEQEHILYPETLHKLSLNNIIINNRKVIISK